MDMHTKSSMLIQGLTMVIHLDNATFTNTAVVRSFRFESFASPAILLVRSFPARGDFRIKLLVISWERPSIFGNGSYYHIYENFHQNNRLYTISNFDILQCDNIRKRRLVLIYFNTITKEKMTSFGILQYDYIEQEQEQED